MSIDLNTKRFVKAKLDDEVLNAKEATILLWYNAGEYRTPFYLFRVVDIIF